MRLPRWPFRRALEPALFCPRSGHELRHLVTPDGTYLLCFPCGTFFDHRDAIRAPKGA
jgi:hypothetical protein